MWPSLLGTVFVEILICVGADWGPYPPFLRSGNHNLLFLNQKEHIGVIDTLRQPPSDDIGVITDPNLLKQ